MERSPVLSWTLALALAGALTVPGALRAQGAGQATGQISGTVTAEGTQRPLEGASVTVVGGRQGALVGADGRYTIAGVPPGPATVQARMIGHTARTQAVTVAAGQTATADFQLVPAATQLEAVVAVGYGTRTAASVTGSVTAVSSQNIERLPVSSPDQALAGQAPGVQVNQGTGAPGGGPQIQIRGVGAIGAGSQPLYVVDGFPLPASGNERRNPLADIRPEDIESMSILKDASSAAIYGSRAANGVVIITTKSGRAQRARFEMTVSTGIQEIPSQGSPDMMSAQEFAQFQKELAEDHVRYDLRREPTINDVPEAYRDPASVQGVDWFNAITRAAPMNELNFNVSGGSQSVSAYVSGGYLQQDGVVRGTSFDRYSFRANVRGTLGSRFNVGLNVAPVYSRRHLPLEGGGGTFGELGGNNGGAVFGPAKGLGLGTVLITTPVAKIRNDDGTLVPTIVSPGTFRIVNPLLQIQELEDETRDFRTLGTAFGEYELMRGLKLRTSLNGDYYTSRYSFFHPSTLALFNQPPGAPAYSQYSTQQYLNWQNENLLTYNATFATDHTVDAVAGVSVQKNNAENSLFNGQQYSANDIQTLNAAPLITGGTGAEDWGLLSYLGRVSYDFRNRYFVSAAVRRDGSSRFGRENRWGTFPSVGLGWHFTQEPLFRGMGWLNDGKLRFSYGRTGNQEIGNFDYVGRVAPQNYVLGGALAAGRADSTLGNPLLGWEQSEESNLGVDLVFLNNRLSMSAEVYQKYTKDLLLRVEIPQSSGFANVTQNTGKIRNQGLEVGVHTVNLAGGPVQWTTDFNWAMNRNKVLALSGTGAPIFGGWSGESNPTNITKVGSPVGMFFGYVFEGIYQNQAEIDATPHISGAIPGVMRVKDVNGDGQITPVADFDVIGNPYPDATFGITNNLTWRSFDLRVLTTGQIGGDRLRAFNESVHNIDGVFNVTRDIKDRWRSPEQPGSGEVPTTAGPSLGRVMFRDVSSLWVEDASNFWIRNVTLRYTLPERLTSRLGTGASVYASVQNAHVFTDYPGNPEVTNYGGRGGGSTALSPGIDYAAYPVPRIWTIGTQVSW